MTTFKDLKNRRYTDIDLLDWPRFTDAYMNYAELQGVPLNEEQLEFFNNKYADLISAEVQELGSNTSQEDL